MENITTKQPDKYQYLIIGGTIKAATTSLFNYISAHPQVCGSKVKETFFFTHGFTGDSDTDHAKYASYFTPRDETRVLFEASPHYLAYKENIAPRIKQLIPEVKLLFILRNPVDRLYSHFNFAKGKLELPDALTFEQYIELCESFNAGQISPAEAGVAVKHLRAMEMGNYATYLQDYFDVFDAANVKVIFFDDLKKNPQKLLAEICDFIGVDPSFYEKFSLKKVNVTFSARMKLLHYFVLRLNRMLESVLRHRPALKQRLVKLYKYLNQSQEGYESMQDTTRKKLISYYAASNSRVLDILKGQSLPTWLCIK